MSAQSPAREEVEARRPAPRWKWRAVWLGLLAVWFSILCIVPDPRPLAAPEALVQGAVSLLGMEEASARLVATIAFRAGGLFALGILCALAAGTAHRVPVFLVLLVVVPLIAAALGVAALWVNLEYFPIELQFRIGVLSAMLGAWSGFALRRSRFALAGLAVVVVGLMAWGSSTGISDDLDAVARVTGRHVLGAAHEIPEGEEGFEAALEVAFRFAARNSGRHDYVMLNRASILALGIILGEERIADVAKREIDMRRLPEAEALRDRITLRGRKDWARHFWVSAGLTVLTGEDRTMSIGLLKELMDSTPGGSGFSFADLVADRAGNLFALAATRDEESARAMQERILAGARVEDFFPPVRGLPGRIRQDELQEEFGGLGGEGTQAIVEDIRRRLATCEGLW
jgi:hypothetical protein